MIVACIRRIFCAISDGHSLETSTGVYTGLKNDKAEQDFFNSDDW